LTDLKSGFTDNLVLANTSNAVQADPRFLGRSDDRIVFQSNRTGNYRLYAFNRTTGLLDTLPVANTSEPNTDNLLRNVLPKIGAGTPAGVGDVNGNGQVGAVGTPTTTNGGPAVTVDP
jgi:hypothetical protein